MESALIIKHKLWLRVNAAVKMLLYIIPVGHLEKTFFKNYTQYSIFLKGPINGK